MSVAHDVLYALRQIIRDPGGPLIIVLSLGFALGINTSLFSFVNAVWFTPWAVEDSEGLRIIRPDISWVEWRDWSEQTRSFSGLAARQSGPLVRMNGRLVHFELVSANYFQVLGVAMQAGPGFGKEEGARTVPADSSSTREARGLSRGDDVVNAAGNTAVISHHFWQTHFGSDANIIGRSITLDQVNPRRTSVSLTVVGVAAPGFEGPDNIRRQLWLPLTAAQEFQSSSTSQDDGATSARHVMAFGRLAPGMSDTPVTAELSTLSSRFRSQSRVSLTPISVRSTGAFSQSPPSLQSRLMLASLLVGIAFITLIACANVSNLLLARGHARRGEIAVRRALGAGRRRVIRQLLTESFVLILVAAWLGIMIALWLPEAVFRNVLQDASLGLAESLRLTFSLDHRVFLWVLAMSMTACVAFALAPALRCTEVSVGEVLKEAHGISGAALMSSLLGYQTIVSVMALAIAGLILRSEPVDEARQIRRSVADLTIVRLEARQDVDALQWQTLVATLADRLGTMAGSQNVAGVTGQLPSGTRQSLQVTSDYFAALRMPWASGRTFVPSDPTDGVMVVNEAFARRFWPGQSAIGQTLPKDDPRMRDKTLTGRRVVGVVSDAQVSSPMAYVPARPGDVRMFLVRASRDRIVREALPQVTRLYPSVTTEVLPGSEWITPAARVAMVGAYVTMAFGAAAIILGIVGYFSLLEYAVRQRTREIGIRRALGAAPRHVVSSLIAPALRALIRGLLIGCAGAAGVGVILRQAEIPAGVNPLDLLTYAAVAGAVAIAGLLASYAPARRAIRIAPAEALRYH